MNKILQSLESYFAIASLVFFTRVLDFESFSKASEGTVENIAFEQTNAFAPYLSLIQHGIFLVVFGLLVLRSRDTIRTITKGKVIWILIGFVLLSFLWSNVPDLTFRGAFAFAESCAFGLYFASRYNIKEQLRLVACALGIATVISLLYAIALPQHGIEAGIHAGAWRGPFVQKNIFARILVLSCLSYACIETKSLTQKFFIFVGLALSAGLIVMSDSKTALVVLALLLLLYIVYRLLRFKDILAIPLILISLLLSSAVGIAILNNAETILNNIGKDLTLSGRTTIWAILVEQIKLRPWFGHGYMGFWSDRNAIALMTKAVGTNYVPPHSHNGYLELVTGFGFLGTLLFVITFIALVRRAFILILRDKSNEGFWPILFLSYLVFYDFSEPTLIEHNSIFWIIYLSLAVSRFVEFQLEPQFLATKTITNKMSVDV